MGSNAIKGKVNCIFFWECCTFWRSSEWWTSSSGYKTKYVCVHYVMFTLGNEPPISTQFSLLIFMKENPHNHQESSSRSFNRHHHDYLSILFLLESSSRSSWLLEYHLSSRIIIKIIIITWVSSFFSIM